MYSYCGIHAHDVCCFVPENAEPVGILPTPSRSRCGKKGFDSGHEGEADMAEWPWHVSNSNILTLRSLKRVHARSLIFRILAIPTRQISTVRSLDDKNL